MIISFVKKNFGRFLSARYIFYSIITDKIFFFVYFLILARLFEKNIYGEIITLFTLCNVTAFFVSLGLPVYLQRIVAIKKNESGQDINIALLLTTVLIFVYFPFIFFFTVFLYPSVQVILVLIIGSIVYVYNYISLINAVYNGFEEYKKFFTILFSVKVLMLLIVIFIYVANINDVKIFLVVLLFTVSAQSLIQFFFIKVKHFTLSIEGINFNAVKELIIILLPLYLATIFNFMYDKIDVLIISKIIDFNEVANYSIAYGIYKSSTIFFMPFLVSGYTKISYLSRRESAIRIFIRKYLSLITIGCSFVIIFLLIFSKQIVVILYSNKFENSAEILRVLCLAILFMGLNNLLGNVLNALGKFKENRNVTFLALVLNIILNIILIPFYGIIAAAIVTIFTEFLVFIGDAFYLRRFMIFHKKV